MKISIHQNYEELSKATADFITEAVRRKPNAMLCFPSGESPTGTFRYLVAYAQAGQVDFSNCYFIGLDEWVGLDENDEGSCRHYMYAHLFDPLQIAPGKIIFFDGKAPDLDQECNRINNYIRQYGPIDVMLVGIGMNGHIGLNEPGVDFNLYAHHAELDSITKTVAQKYFNQETQLHKGITLGLQHLQEARTAVLLASGAKKAQIIAQALEGEVTNKVPASIMQRHPNSIIFLDEEAASELKQAEKHSDQHS